ncbi:MAG: hypothetical protein ACYTGZ_00565 [Planctomycetota bacterium]|jgi:hypothetical protein
MTIEHELQTLLREDTPSEEQRAAWVEAALHAPRAQPARVAHRRGWWIAAAAAAVIVVFATSRGTEEPEREVTPAAEPAQATEGVAAERAANYAALKSVSGDKWKAWKGQYAIVAGGEVAARPKLEDALRWAEKNHPEVKHRFLFQVSHTPPYNLVGDRSPVANRIAGMGFLGAAGIKLEGKPGAWTVRRGDRVVAVATKEPVIKLTIEGRAISVRIETGSLCPIVLPEKTTFPRAEIPGTATYEGLDRKWRSFQQYLVHVRQADLGLDMPMEAVGAQYDGAITPGNVFGVRLGGHVFQSLHGDPALRAQKEGRPLLVVHLNDKDTEKLNALFDPLDFPGYSQCLVTGAERSELRRYTKEGKLVGKLALPADRDVIRKFVR